MQTFGVSKSIKLLTICVIAISMALIIAIVIGINLHTETPPPGNLDNTTPNDDTTVATQMNTPAWFQDNDNIKFSLDQENFDVAILS